MAPRRPDRAPASSRLTSEAAAQITGPTSALTSFLREQGITGHVGDRRPGVVPPPPQTADEGEEGDREMEIENAIAGPSTSTTTTTLSIQSGSSTKRKKGKEEEGNKKKGKRNEEEGVPKGVVNRPQVYAGVKQPGQIASCAECGRKFTVTKYTTRNPLGDGLVCSPCGSETFDSAPKKVVVRVVKKRVVQAVEARAVVPLRTLQQVCIAVIGQQINNVDALGDVGSRNLDKISKIVCKHRALTSENLEVFLDISHRELSLYDCTNVKANELAGIAAFCPRLERLELRMCGRMDGSVLEAWGKGLKQLTSLSLYGPYSITFEQWKKYLATFGEDQELGTFRLMQSARFNDDCIKILVEKNPHLFDLQLSELGRMNDASLSLLHPLTNLTSLDISRAGVDQGKILTDSSVIDLLKHVGQNLVSLILDQNYLLTSDVLILGIHPHCPYLRTLSLRSLSLLNSEVTAAFFKSWTSNTGLTSLDLHRCIHLENDALEALLDHSGHCLKKLDLHSIDEIDEGGLEMIVQKAGKLEVLDVSFVRAVDDTVVKSFLGGIQGLEVLFVHGCNRVTRDCPQRRGCSIRGMENVKNVF